MRASKIEFLTKTFPEFVLKLKPNAKGKLGKLHAQQMVEHMSEYLRIASGKQKMEAVYTPEVTQKAYSFMMTEKPFRENTPNQLLHDIPPPGKHKTMDDAIAELRDEISDFFDAYSKNPGMRNVNPFFGNLNFEEQVQLLHKHATHHARQFGLVE